MQRFWTVSDFFGTQIPQSVFSMEKLDRPQPKQAGHRVPRFDLASGLCHLASLAAAEPLWVSVI